MVKNTSVPLKRSNGSLKLLNYSFLRTILRVNGFEFVLLGSNSIDYNESSLFVFPQLVSNLDRNHFNHISRKYDGNKYVRHFPPKQSTLQLLNIQNSTRKDG